MFTTGSKWFLGLGVVAYVLAVVYGYSTDGTSIGPLVFGFHGAVGERFAYGALVGIATGAFLLGGVILGVRDAEPVALAQASGIDVVPPVPRSSASYWPVVAAFAAGLLAIGLVVGKPIFIAALVLGLAVAVEWTVQAWSDRATGDPATNRRIRDRLMQPFEIPIIGAVIIAAPVLAFSRVLLATSEHASVYIDIAVAAVVLLVGVLIALRPRIGTAVIAVVLTLGALAVIAAGIVAASHGEREFERHGEAGQSQSLGVLGGSIVVERS
jgi:hypothetical protein